MSHHPIESLLKKYDAAAPRYTSYPPIPFWGEVNGNQVKTWLSEADPRLAKEPLSLYVHIPFCKTRCYYCGCFVIISPHTKPADAYMDTVHQEMALVR
ncbi:MAG: oxygen-independent coproporphyrinogen III oxidase, partial [Deltaproteobacteria bacterium]|nr:oxygen-independent coproporphyrinogen III oxidase [Deltaproteobacteria bacterium]